MELFGESRLKDIKNILDFLILSVIFCIILKFNNLAVKPAQIK